MSSINKELMNEQGICIGDRIPGGGDPTVGVLTGGAPAGTGCDRPRAWPREVCVSLAIRSILVITDGSSSLAGNGVGLYDLLVRY